MAAPLGFPAVRQVLLYSRPGCGLCDEARAVILAERERSEFEFAEEDVTDDDALEREYGIRIPVVLIDGEERFEVRVDPRSLARAVRG
jgi:glutaredoxin